MEAIRAIRKAQRPQGPTTIMAIATANPSNRVEQSAYADQYFRVTNSDHLQDLKHKFHRMCTTSMIKRRNMYLTEEILKERPRMCGYNQPSFDHRQDIVVEEIPKLAMEAATKAIQEWGRPKSDVTHLVFASTCGVDIPGADYRLVHLLGLPLTVQRIMIYSQACHMGAAMLRIANDIALNNKDARVLVVSCEMATVLTFRGPDEADFESLVAQVTFADGAAALIVGADPIPGLEKAIFEVIHSIHETVPGTGTNLGGQFKELGLTLHFSQLPLIISSNIERCLLKAFEPLGISNWNDVFWVSHSGTWSIMDAIEAKLGLTPEKLRASRHVFSEHGNMLSATVLFVMDRMRKQSEAEGRSTTGDGLEWGVCFGFGPGFSIETVVLRSVPL